MKKITPMMMTMFVLFAVCFTVTDGLARPRPKAATAKKAALKRSQESDTNSIFDRLRAKTCSLGTMEGRHGYTYSGTVIGVGPIATAGPISFDGAGALKATYVVSVNGVIFQGEFTGTYTVSHDCTGTVTLFLPKMGMELHGSFVIVNNGKETFFTGNDAGYAITGATKKIAP